MIRNLGVQIVRINMVNYNIFVLLSIILFIYLLFFLIYGLSYTSLILYYSSVSFCVDKSACSERDHSILFGMLTV